MKMLHGNPPGSVSAHRERANALEELQSILKTKSGFSFDREARKPRLTRAKQWVLSGTYDKEFSRLFDSDGDDVVDLFALTYFAAIRSVQTVLCAPAVIRCAVCALPMLKEGKRTYCSVECRTRFNNEKRDPIKHNAAEKKNRKQRIVSKNAKNRRKS
jgi:hypothetical protein